MATRWVSPDGDDAGVGDVSSPFQTLAHAVAVAASGDTIRLTAGIHLLTETVEITQPLTVVGAGQGRTRLLSVLSKAPQIRIQSTQAVQIRDLWMDNGTAEGGSNLWVECVHDLQVERVTFFRPARAGLLVTVPESLSGQILNKDIQVLDCDFVGMRIHPGGSSFEQLVVANTEVLSVVRCRFRDIPETIHGLGIFERVEGALLYRCTFRGRGPGEGIGLYYGITTRSLLVVGCDFEIHAPVRGAQVGDHESAIADLRAEGIGFLGCRFRAVQPDPGSITGAAALELQGVSGALVWGCLFTECAVMAIKVGRTSSPGTGWADEIHIYSCTFEEWNRSAEDERLNAAIYLAGGGVDPTHVTLRQCVFLRLSDVPQPYAVRIEDPTVSAPPVVIEFDTLLQGVAWLTTG